MPLTDPFAIPRRLLPAARKALAEGRLFWRSTDAQGRPCNGGAADPVSIGVWAPRVEGQIVCETFRPLANLSGANLRGWARGPDGYARRMK